MNIYMSLYIWSILTWGASQFVSKEMRKLFFVILVFPFLFFVLGGRGPGVGTDTYMYNDLFYTLQGLFDGNSADCSCCIENTSWIDRQQFTAFKPLAHRPKPMLAKP